MNYVVVDVGINVLVKVEVLVFWENVVDVDKGEVKELEFIKNILRLMIV